MKKNQLFGILALMMALGMSFPATTFAAHDSNSHNNSHSSSLEASTNESDLATSESTAETGTLPSDEQEGKDEDEEDKDGDDHNDDDSDGDDDGDTDGAEEQPAEGEIKPGMVSSYADLITVLNDAEFAEVSEIRLVNDIIVDDDIQIARDVPTIIDLNGHSIISCGNEMVGRENAHVIDVEYGEVTITGEGSIMAMGIGGIAINVKGSINESSANYATIIIDEQVRLHAPNSYGIVIGQGASAAYGVSVELRGSISAQDGIYINGSVQGAGDNAPIIQLADASVINAEDTGIVAAGFGNWQCGASTITSATGIKAYSGNFTFTNTDIHASGENILDDGTGATFLFGGQASENTNIVINGGNYESDKDYIFADYGTLSEIGSNLESLEIQDGKFSSPIGIFYGFDAGEDDEDGEEILINTSIRGGIFSADVTDFLASGMHLEETDDGNWIVIDEAALELIEAKVELQALIDVARSKDEMYYTEDSYKKLAIAIETAQRLLAQNELTLDQVNDISVELNEALDSLELSGAADPSEITAARQELSDAISAAKQLDPNKYDTDDYQDFMDLIAEAEVLLAQSDATIEDIQGMLGEIDAMREILLIFDEEQAFTTAKLALEELIEDLNLLLSEVDPSDMTFDELRTALVEAAGLLAEEADGITSNELENTYSHLNALKDAFFPDEMIDPEDPDQDPELPEQPNIPDQPDAPETPGNPDQPDDSDNSNTDKTLSELRHGLTEMLAAVVGLTISDYRPEFTSQYYELQAAIAEARELLANEATTAASLAEVMNKILVATSGLRDTNEPSTPIQPTLPSNPPLPETPAPTLPSNPSIPSTPSQSTPAPAPAPALDTTILGQMIAQIAKLDANKYTPASYAKILAVLEQAKSTIANPTATQTDIDHIVLSLYQASMELTPTSYVANNSASNTPTASQSRSQTNAYQTQAPTAASRNDQTPSRILPNTGTISAQDDNLSINNDLVAPSLMMSALAGMYTGLAMYRKSRIAAKNAKHLRRR